MRERGVIQVAKVYYWNARLNGQTCLLTGPFLTAREAEDTADLVSPVLLLKDPSARNATFGVVEMNAPGAGPGEFNQYLPPEMLGNMLLLAEPIN